MAVFCFVFPASRGERPHLVKCDQVDMFEIVYIYILGQGCKYPVKRDIVLSQIN